MNSAPSVPVPVKSPRKKSNKTLYIIIAGLLVVVTGLAILAARKPDLGISVTVEKAQRRTITQVVTATGKIQPEIEVKILPEVYGEITQLPFREGMRVKKGQLIVKIKPDMYQAQVDQNTAGVASTQGAAMSAAARAEKAEQDLRRYEDLYRRKLASESDYASYKAAYDGAKADLEAARANVQQAMGSLGQARDALSKTSIYAPMDGTVSSRSSEVGESVVATQQFAGTEIMRVADLTNMEVRVDVNENDLPNVKVGNHVEISIDAYPDRKFAGVVKEIASSSENAGAGGSGSSAQSSGSSSNEVTNFLVKIRVEDRDVELRPGMSATADIQTHTVDHAVVVPIQSVTVRTEGGLTSEEWQNKEVKDAKDTNGVEQTVADEKQAAWRRRGELQRVVFIRTGDKVRMQKVETGIADNTWIEVKSGVKPGDEVVSGTYAAISRTLKDGSKVTIQKSKPATGAGS
jgi:HlyD family secretion protein